ncbi:lipase family protein [Acetobacteraceae bacterium KSS8]|uniref:Lipase family protein n=1 Tax=Endosaccharibacter trunci TaxID=2812733 RepID=A0ABT1WCZ5_9PROT|nr:lipase family protein [Acetobacteraceae bacterium KSS8]
MRKAGPVLLQSLAGVLCLGIGLANATDAARGPSPDPRMGDGGVSSFYDWTGALPSGPGRMLRQEPLPSAMLPPHAASGTRILYSSLSGVGRQGPAAVSGLLLLPRGAAPAGGWPVVAWAHGTTGFADVCAPSWRGRPARDNAYLDGWLSRGFAIVATDYEGLGTPGDHPYLLYRSEAHSILDGVRAALSDPGAELRNRIILVGQSQGAGAALGAAWLHPLYAPELDIKAAVLTGLVTGIATAQTHDKAKIYSDPNRMDPSFAMLRFAGTDHALHPSADLQGFLTPKGEQMLGTALHGCLHDLFAEARKLDLKNGGQMFSRSIGPIDDDMEANFTIPDGHVAMPVFVGTGLADGEAGAGGQYDAVAAMCSAGSPVVWHTYPGLTHNGTVNGSSADSAAFVASVLDGHPPRSNCASIAAPGPLQSPTPGVVFNN